MTETAAAPAPKPRRAPKPKPPPEDRGTLLRRLLADIEEHDHHAHRPALYERLFGEEKLRVRTDPDGVTEFRLAGIVGESTSGTAGALMDWTRAARRELLALPEDPAA